MNFNSAVQPEMLLNIRRKYKTDGKKVVFTNGCFDILHAGHVDYLRKAKNCGDVLIVGLNTDDSVRRIKGKNRPIINQDERAFVISALKPVDYVVFFDEDTPENLISFLIPDVLVKGSDWRIENIAGRKIVEDHGGQIITIDFVTHQSTSAIIDKILQRFTGINK
ncbi:MAG: D-glycero-beta-D-manno-heptose 1-phosphate adenylyltransferase [Ignavibacteriaceae bacterium]